MAHPDNKQVFIVADPSIRFGKPRVNGTRITVEDVMELVNANVSPTEIIKDYYPALTVDDIQACINFNANPES